MRGCRGCFRPAWNHAVQEIGAPLRVAWKKFAVDEERELASCNFREGPARAAVRHPCGDLPGKRLKIPSMKCEGNAGPKETLGQTENETYRISHSWIVASALAERLPKLSVICVCFDEVVNLPEPSNAQPGAE